MDEERSGRLREFVAWCKKYITGDEKGEAQIYLDRLFQALGHGGCLDVGGTPEFRLRKPRQSGGGTAFADYVWKPHVLIEMKKRGADLNKHYRQAFDYWVRLVPGRPRYVILCNFDEFWIYDFETQMDTPVDRLALEDLPDRWGPLAFLFPAHERPVFGYDLEQVTRDAADKLAVCFNKLINRNVPRETAQRFVLQMLVALFAEDIDLLPQYFVARLLDDCKEPADSFDLLGGLFEEMNRPGKTSGGRFIGVDYFNGGLFEVPARVELRDDELNQLRAAAKADWSMVRPEIFGTLFEHSLEAKERHAYGGHFTTAVDIMKIVGPTIVQPWRDAIDKAARGPKPIQALEGLHHRMQQYRVLDPACGSGNFLYLAYRELKRIEGALFEKLDEVSKRKDKRQRRLSFVTARQFYGIDINPFAVEIAKVTMMIARKLSIDELDITEPALPLDNLDDNFITADALITPLGETGDVLPTMLFAELEEDPFASGNVIPSNWPPADVIIGNPPFLGSKRLKPERGADYVNAVRKTYPGVPGMADYCVYWFRRVHDHLPNCTRDDPVAGRAGLVGTQNIRNNKSRVGGLDYICKDGTVIEAVDNQPWSGEANVHVSIVNWVKTKNKQLLPKHRRLWYQLDAPKDRARTRRASGAPAHKEYELAYRDRPHINSALSDRTDVSTALKLSCNREPQRAFQGMTPGYSGFLLQDDELRGLIKKDPAGAILIRAYLIGRELVSRDGRPQRFIVDADALDLLSLARYPAMNRYLRSHVLPSVQTKYDDAVTADTRRARREHLNRWWTFWARRKNLRLWMSEHRRIIAGSRTQRRPFIFEFISTEILPGDKLQLFAFTDDYSHGVIQASPHCLWYRERTARLKNEVDHNYSSTSVFDTFPWPQAPSNRQIDAVAKAGREVRRIRTDALTKITGGLRAVYRTLELPGRNPLKDAHAALDTAVLEAYGFDPKDDLLRQLLHLNLQVADRIDRGKTVVSPGVPLGYPNPEALVTDDCIRPPDTPRVP